MIYPTCDLASLELLPIPLWAIAASGRVCWANRAALRYWQVATSADLPPEATGEASAWLAGAPTSRYIHVRVARPDAAETLLVTPVRPERDRDAPLYCQFVESVAAILYEADPETLAATYVSPEVETALGYPRARWTDEPDFWHAHLHPADHAEAIAGRRAAPAGRTHTCTYRMQAASGGAVWLRDTFRVLCDATGRPLRLHGAIVPLGDRRADLDPDNRDARFRQIAENIREMFYVSDVDSEGIARPQIRYASPAYEAIWGRPVAELETNPLAYLDGIHPRDRDRLRRTRERLRDGCQTEVEYRVCRPDRTVRWVRDRAVPLRRDGRIYRIVGTVEDITERHETLAALRRSESLFRLLFDKSPVGLAVVNAGGCFHHANRALRLTLGYSIEELEHLSGTELIHPDDRPECAARDRQLWSGAIASYRHERRYLTKTGEVRHILLVKTVAVRDTRGRPQLALSQLLDISERKQTEAALQQRDRYLSALADVQNRLLAAEDVTSTYSDVLARLGRAADASRAYIFRATDSDRRAVSQVAEWCAPGVPPEIDNPDLQNFPLHEHLPQIAARLAAGELVFGVPSEFPTAERECLEAQGIRSVLFVPLHVEDEFAGFLGFDQCDRVRHWSEREMQLLQATGRTLSLALSRQQTQQALHASEAKYRSIFERVDRGIFQTTRAGRYLSVNPSLARLYGYDSPESLVASITDIGRQLYVNPNRREELIALVETGGDRISGCESEVRRRDGSTIWIAETMQAVRDRRGEVQYYEGTVEDITTRRHTEAQLRHQANHDALTGLPNRHWFARSLATVLESDRQDYAVLFVDLDRFKAVNDRLGHLAGDRVLCEVAQRLRDCLRDRDAIARFGGDEFAVLLAAVADPAAAERIARRLLAAIELPVRLDGDDCHISASIGVVCGDRRYRRADDLLRDADSAMYAAKHRGGGGVEFQRHLQRHFLARRDFERALRERQFHLHYQPIVCLETCTICGFEALLRWQHPERGWLAPEHFLPLAVETGAIADIGQWVLERACRQLHAWQQQYPHARDLTLSINLAIQQFDTPDLARAVADLLATLDLDPRCVQLELTEAGFSSAAHCDVFEQLCRIGVGWCIDDFGTGQFSLAHLPQLPLAALKIDRCFVAALPASGPAAAIAQTILDLARNLQVRAISEGVETVEQWQRLREWGCRLGQGFLFSRPLPAAAATELLARGSAVPAAAPVSNSTARPCQP